MENQDPKFAKWMREHGKMAVLKDDEVDRLEKANHAASGLSKQNVMESMYGRLDPKPQGEVGGPSEQIFISYFLLSKSSDHSGELQHHPSLRTRE